MKYHLLRTAAVLALGLLGGCSTYHAISAYIRSDSAAKCPDAAILANTASLPAFNPAAGADPSSVIYKVAMTGVSMRCDFDKHDNTADTRVQFTFHAVRPPGGLDVHYRVPYYVAITSGPDVLDKKIYWMQFGFDQGQTAADGQYTIESTIVKVAKEKTVDEYHLILGFQLTEAQLNYNAKMGRYEP